MLAFGLDRLFVRGDDGAFTEEERERYDRIYESALLRADRTVRENGPFDKRRFIEYVLRTRPVLAHGSNRADLASIAPARQTLANGSWADALFATKDAAWSIFYAVFDRSKLRGGFRNGCFKTASGTRHYFFSLTRETMDAEPWTRGIVYLLPDATFRPPGRRAVYFDEWTSPQAVAAEVRVEVSPDDFPWRNYVTVHGEREPVWKTWLLYKRRVARAVRERRRESP